MAGLLMDKLLPNAYGKPYSRITLEQPFFPKLPFNLTYVLNLPLEGIPNKLEGVAFGIFVDFQIAYEKAQGKDPRCYTMLFYVGKLGHCSSFSNEDLPSDYLGFVSRVKSMLYEEIILMLDPSGGEAHATRSAWVFDPAEIFANF